MRTARNYVQMCDRLYRQACEHDGIDPEAEIAVFNPDNSYAKKYNAVFNQEKYDRARSLAR